MGTEYRFIKPRPGLLLRDPHTYSPIPETGAVVPWVGPHGRYWRRRVNCGDCFIATPPKEIKPETKKNLKKEKQED